MDLLYEHVATMAYFSVHEDDDDLRGFGNSKGGGWSPQVVVALGVT